MSKDGSSQGSGSFSELTLQTSASNTGDYEKLIAELKKQLLTLQSKNATLKRSVPRMVDIEGKDITSEVQKLCNELAISEQSSEDWQNRFAESEQKFARFQRTASEELNAKDQQIVELKTRAKALEEENNKLKEQVANDMSKIHHLENNQDANEQYELTMGEFDNDQDLENIEKLKQELAGKVDENDKLVQKLAEAQQKLAELRTRCEKIQRATDIRDAEDDSIFAVPKLLNATYSDVEYVVNEILLLLQHLQGNTDNADSLRENVLSFLRSQGINVDQKNVAELEKDLEISVGKKFEKRRSLIKNVNNEFATASHCRLDNQELARCLKQLSEDSMFTASRQQLVDSQQTSFCEVHGRSATRTDILNRTVDVAEDLGAVIERMNGLQTICDQLFGKLRGTAEFLTSLLDHLEDNEDGQELLRKINEIKLDLEKSFGEAKFLVEQVKKAEKAVIGLREMLQHTKDQTLEESSHLQAEVPQVIASGSAVIESMKMEVERLKSVEKQCEALKSTLKNELAIKEVLEQNLSELQKQLDQKSAHFNRVINDLNAQLSSEKSNAIRMHRAIEEKNRAIGAFERLEKEKDLALASSERECADLNRLVRNANENSQMYKMQVLELSSKCQGIVQLSKEQKIQIDDKIGFISELESELFALRKKTQDLAGGQGQASMHLEKKLIALSKDNSDLKKENAQLQKELDIMASESERREAVLAKSNNLLYAKIKKECPDGKEFVEYNTLTDKADESVSGFDEFTSFLADCRDRSNNLVQLVKKADTTAAALGHSIPYLQNMFNETRAIRMMLHKIANFFKSQKENFKSLNTKFGQEIRLELKKIYESLQAVIQSYESEDINAMKPVAREINYVRRQ
uniref:Uncharacterized protein n=1 Tax=Ditylenchus dipsaci TaxID=166011 RepID=A0A915DH82_9BILA